MTSLRTGSKSLDLLLEIGTLSIIVREDEAKKAGLSKQNLEAAMRQLFKNNKIWNEPYGQALPPALSLRHQIKEQAGTSRLPLEVDATCKAFEQGLPII